MREPKPQEDLQAIIDDIYRELTPRLGEGKVADYIPQLARVDARHFGMAIVTTGGEVYRVGDAEMPFSIQSISKVFTLTLALGKHGENIWNRVGREPSGSAFNSIVQLEHEGGKRATPHQCRRDQDKRPHSRRPHAEGTDRRDRSLRSLPRG